MPRVARLLYVAVVLVAPFGVAACSATQETPAAKSIEGVSDGEGIGLSRPPGLGEDGSDSRQPAPGTETSPPEGTDQPTPAPDAEATILPGDEEELVEGEAYREYEEARRKATAACYEYAHAQTLHDRQIIYDQNAAFDDSTFDPNLARIQSQAEEFGLKRREKRLIESCLRAKGF